MDWPNGFVLEFEIKIERCDEPTTDFAFIIGSQLSLCGEEKTDFFGGLLGSIVLAKGPKEIEIKEFFAGAIGG
jgi:hypothetical protein